MNTKSDCFSTKESIRSKPFIPERELLIAVLDRAVVDYHGAKGEMRLSAAEWIFGNPESSETFSFCWVCEYLDLRPKCIRQEIERLEIPMHNAQGRRWLRRKVKRSTPFLPEITLEQEAA